MKKIILLVSIFLIGIAWQMGKSTGNIGVVKSVSTIQNVQPTPSSVPVGLSNPVSLSISSINIHAAIEHVGLDEKLRMDVPKDDMNVAWYKLGARIGEKGSAVIAGHFDTKAGRPAVFFEINKLQIGDEITVTDQDGKAIIFIVEATKTVKDATFPIEEVFARDDKVRLNLITCAGVFNRANQNYEDRFVVYAVAKDVS